MLKIKNIIPNISVVMVLIIICVSMIPSYIKIVLAILTISFLIPVVREKMWVNRLRKIKVAFYTSIIFSLGSTVVPILKELPYFDISIVLGFLIIFFFSSIGIFCYGIPVSIIAEVVSNRYPKYRAWLSGVIHIVFGFFTVIFGLFDELDVWIFIIPTICSVIFFLIDEVTIRRLKESYS